MIYGFELNKNENVLKPINLQLAILKMKLEVHALSIMKAFDEVLVQSINCLIYGNRKDEN